MVKPVTPSELRVELPDYVIEGINRAIKNKFRGKKSFTIKQNEIVAEILGVAPEGVSRAYLFENHFLDFEQLYRDAGWMIEYISPDRDENFEEYFQFTMK